MSNNNSDDVVRSRIDASSTRLTSLRTPASGDSSAAPARRPKFVPKAAKRRPEADDAASPADASAPASSSASSQPHAVPREHHKGPRGEFVRDRHARSGRSSDAGRGRGGGRGGRSSQLPAGKVAFVGTLSGGSSYSASSSTSTAAPRASSSKQSAAADGVGISVLDDAHAVHGSMFGLHVDEQQQWPPVVTSTMAPMSLPVARQPEPPHVGAVFTDVFAHPSLLPEDALLFLQFPTTMPLANAVATLPPGKQNVDMAHHDDAAAADADDAMSPADVKRSKLAVKSETPAANTKKSAGDTAATSGSTDDSAAAAAGKTTTSTTSPMDEQVYDKSIAAAPGGYIGKLCIRKSGKTVLMIGDKQFEVAVAQTPSFVEEMYSVDALEQQLYMLGSVERHLVVTPDFDALLA